MHIFAQLWHVGAISHPDLLGGELPVPPSWKTSALLRPGQQQPVDGVELHGANAYLVQQFLAKCTNRRTDRYGGSIENRTRFLFEVIDAVKRGLPAGRIGLKINPYG